MIKKINWRYAAGELLIVIAGITIAFALNNWAQGKQDHALAEQYLQNLKTDIEADMAAIDTNIHKLTQIGEAIESYIPHLFRAMPGRESIPGSIFQKIHDYVYFYPHQATYQSMLHSGDLKLITDFKLKNQIVEHYNSYDRLFKELERQEHFAQQYTAEYFMKKTDHVLLFQNKQASLLDDPYLKNLVFSSKGIIGLQIKAHEAARVRCADLKAALEDEINGR